MPLYVFECQKCKHLIKHSLGGNIGGIYIFDCPSCKDNNRFKFIREGSSSKDWYSNVIKIKNRKRRDHDRLHVNEQGRKGK